MMQDWDRLAIIAVGLAVSVYVGCDGYHMWKKRRYLGVVGTVILILIAVGVPTWLMLIS